MYKPYWILKVDDYYRAGVSQNNHFACVGMYIVEVQCILLYIAHVQWNLSIMAL